MFVCHRALARRPHVNLPNSCLLSIPLWKQLQQLSRRRRYLGESVLVLLNMEAEEMTCSNQNLQISLGHSFPILPQTKNAKKVLRLKRKCLQRLMNYNKIEEITLSHPKYNLLLLKLADLMRETTVILIKQYSCQRSGTAQFATLLLNWEWVRGYWFQRSDM